MQRNGRREVEAELAVDGVDVDRYDGVIVVGGSGSRTYLWENEAVLDLIRRSHKSGKVVAAIGRGRHVLDNVGLYPGKSFVLGQP